MEDAGLFVSLANIQDDKTEGEYDIEHYADEGLKFASKYMENSMDCSEPDLREGLIESSKKSIEYQKSNNYLSCWFMGSEESAGMWSDYGKEGVMVLSNTFNLNRIFSSSIRNSWELKHVKYDDEEKKKDFREPFKYKNRKHAKGMDQTYQKEFRIVFDINRYNLLTGFEKNTRGISTIGGKPSYESDEIVSCIAKEDRLNGEAYARKKGNGYVLLCDLNKLISEVRVHPGASREYLREVQNLCEKYKLKVTVEASKLEF